VLVELIFAMILTLELVPPETATYTVDVLENAEATMEVAVNRDAEVARFRNADGQLVLTAERSLTTSHVYTAFPAEGSPGVFDTGPAVEAVGPFETSPTQRVSAPPGGEEASIEWTLADRDGLLYLGIPSMGTVLVIRTDVGS
jgi:hypothetical protein